MGCRAKFTKDSMSVDGRKGWKSEDEECDVLPASLRRGSVTMAESREPTTEEKIADALRAAPEYIADSARVVDWDMTTVLRKGTSEWTCVPTPPGAPWPAPMCGDPTTMQWFMEVSQGKSPTI